MPMEEESHSIWSEEMLQLIMAKSMSLRLFSHGDHDVPPDDELLELVWSGQCAYGMCDLHGDVNGLRNDHFHSYAEEDAYENLALHWAHIFDCPNVVDTLDPTGEVELDRQIVWSDGKKIKFLWNGDDR